MEKKQILSIVANNLRTLINKQGLSVSELARRCDISTGTVSKIMAGQMALTIITAMRIADGLNVTIDQLMQGLNSSISSASQEDVEALDEFSVGILSLGNRRITCILDQTNTVIATSELTGGLDLAETSGKLMHSIQEAIATALGTLDKQTITLKQMRLKLVTQSYEFESTRQKFMHFAERYFKEVILLSDWQLTCLSIFNDKPGISLVVDKGVSLSYQYEGVIKKLGGWKFPVYDLGGENWLGAETIRHTVEAAEGYVPMSTLAQTVLSKFNGKIEAITETCFKAGMGADVFCTFTPFLLHAYFTQEPAAIKIIDSGVAAIQKMIARVDAITEQKLDIAMHGSLLDIYKNKIAPKRLMAYVPITHNVELLAQLTKEYLQQKGILIGM